jgi:hypothetical protein
MQLPGGTGHFTAPVRGFWRVKQGAQWQASVCERDNRHGLPPEGKPYAHGHRHFETFKPGYNLPKNPVNSLKFAYARINSYMQKIFSSRPEGASARCLPNPSLRFNPQSAIVNQQFIES